MFFTFQLFIFIFSQNAHAVSASSYTSVGATSVVESLSADGDLSTPPSSSGEKTKERRDQYPWSAGYTYSNSQTTDSLGSAISEKTNSVNGGLGYESPKRFEIGAGYSFSSTPDENLVALAPNVYIGYTFKKGKGAADSVAHIDASEPAEESDFGSSISFKLTGTSNRFVQTYTPNPPPGVRRARRPTTGINEITQTSLQFESSIKPVDWIKIKPSYTIFSYSRSVSDFNSTLSNPRISFSRASFSNTVSSLSDFDAALGLTFYFLESWELALNGDYSVSAADQSSAWVEKAILADNIGDLKIGLGASNQSSATTSDTSAILDLSYDF
jgi:hypothetical protein